MVTKRQLIFQIESSAVLKSFAEDNFNVEYNDSNQVEDDLCVIYFSSNEIYYPNTIEAFNSSILQKNKYEWKRNKLSQARKHIFIRDIRKQWYIGGINEKLDSPIKLLEFLKTATAGYRIFTIGASAGGYGAILFGSLLKANRVYAFNASLNLNIKLKRTSPIENPILFEKAKDKNLNIYFDLSNHISTDSNCYYFQSCHSQMDLDQYDAISLESKKNLKTIRFQTSNHGIPFLRINLSHIFNFDKNRLESLVNKTFHPILFSSRLIGVIPTIYFLIKALKDRYKKKRLESKLKTNLTNSKPTK